MQTTGQKLAKAAQGFGAHLAGNGSQFMRQEMMDRELLDEERKQAVVDDIAMSMQILGTSKNPRDDLIRLYANRNENIQRLNGDNTDTKETLVALTGTDEEAMAEMQEIAAAGQFLQAKGLLPQAQRDDYKGTPLIVERDGKQFAAHTVQRADGSYDIEYKAIDGMVVDRKGQSAEDRVEERREGKRAEGDEEVITDVNKTVAVGDVTDAREAKKQAKVNAGKYNVWRTGVTGYLGLLEDSGSGPFKGLSPALTASQQKVDGAKAIMAPVLKALFRESGEGTFTKDDQEILLNMLPDRGTHPEAAAAMIQAVDNMIRAKMAIGAGEPVPDYMGTGSGEAPPADDVAVPYDEGTIIQDASGKQLIMRGGEWQPM